MHGRKVHLEMNTVHVSAEKKKKKKEFRFTFECS